MTTGIPVYLPLLDNAVELPWRYKSHRNVFPILFFHSAGDMPEPSPVQQFPHLYALSYSGLSVPIYIIYYPKVKKANHCYPRVRDRPSTSITVSLCYFAPTQMSNCSGPVFFNSSAELGCIVEQGRSSDQPRVYKAVPYSAVASYTVANMVYIRTPAVTFIRNCHFKAIHKSDYYVHLV